MSDFPGQDQIVPGLYAPDNQISMRSYKNLLSEKDKVTILINILTEIKKFSDLHILHRDLHSGNILVDTENDFKITFIDWGTAVKTNSDGYYEGPAPYEMFTFETSSSSIIQWANGRDISIALEDTLDLGLTTSNPVLGKLIEGGLKDREITGNEDTGFKHVDLDPYIEKLCKIRDDLSFSPQLK